MKIKLYRQSGTPVDPAQQQEYTEAHRVMYDKCDAKAEAVFQKTTGRLTRVPRMLVLQRLLRYAERGLVRKFNGDAELELPKTAKAWSALISTYGDTPLMVAKESSSGKLVLLLMDDLK